MDKPDPYGDWVLLGTKEGPAGLAHEIDEELLAAARETWPYVLAHVRGEIVRQSIRHGEDGAGSRCLDQVLRSVAKTRQRNQGQRPPISNLESYLIGVFHHRFNRFLKREQNRTKTVELVSSALALERFEAAVDSDWAEQLECAIAFRQILPLMPTEESIASFGFQRL